MTNELNPPPELNPPILSKAPASWVAMDAIAVDEHGVWQTAVCLDRMFENGHKIVAWVGGEDAATSLANAHFVAAAPTMRAALEVAALELESNKAALIGPEWSTQRTMTGRAMLACFQAMRQADFGTQ